MVPFPTMGNDDGVKARIDELRHREEEELAKMLSGKYGIGYYDLTRTSIDTDALRLIAEPVAREHEVAAFDLVGKRISLGVRSPQNPKLNEIREDLKKRGYSAVEFMVSRQSLERAWSRYKDLSFAVESREGVLDISPEALKKAIAEIKTIEDIKKSILDISDLKRAYRISKIAEVVLAGAFAIDASDVHIEPEDESVRVRYRLDGVLHSVATFDTDTYKLLLSRIKLLSGLKLNVKDAPQDGRFSIKLDESEIEIRTSIIPGAYGETVVMRLLNPDTISVPFEDLGMEPKLRALIEREIKNPNGMLLTTGPTGSGKTTTLYACLKKLSSPDVKIITIEDPVEYHLSGIVQTQADQKQYTFIKALRSALRQDPDIIMVGEIRDKEVARTAIDAALTGHFVFSTLHTNNAAGTFPRLVDLDVDPKVFGSAINVAMAQRLVRKLCPHCKKETPLEGEQKKKIEKVLKGLEGRREAPQDVSKMYLPSGCAECNGTGFKGRIGVFEAIVVDTEMDKLLRTLPSEHDIQTLQQKREFLTMAEDGVVKVLEGITSFDELSRVVFVGEEGA